MPEAATNSYKVDRRAIEFTLYEHLQVQQLFEHERFAHLSREECDAVIDQCVRFVTEVTGPLNGPGDRAGCRLEDGQVHHARRASRRPGRSSSSSASWRSRCRSTPAASAARTRSRSSCRSCRAAPTPPSTCIPA